MRRTCFFLLWLMLLPAVAASAPAEHGYPPLYDKPWIFARAMTGAASVPAAEVPVSGLTVPHHLLAADLVAEGFARLRGQTYERIILLCPDHFRRAVTPFAVPHHSFRTCFGPVPLDRGGADILRADALVSASNLFAAEHAVGALLPFVARHFPGVPVLPVALGPATTPEQWDRLARLLRPLFTPETLIIQSTDFSHYLRPREAARHDAETLRVMASGRPELVRRLRQSAHVDSRAAMYLQMTLQKTRNAVSTVLDNRNSAEYAADDEPEPRETTSYMVQLFAPVSLPPSARHPRLVLGGDFFTGRGMRPLLRSPPCRELLVRRVRALTGGAPLLLNLEGVLAAACPDDARALCMEAAPTLSLLRDLGVTAVSLANNHARDLGETGLRETRRLLQTAGIAPLEAGRVHAVGPCLLTVHSDLDNTPRPRRDLLTAADLAVPTAPSSSPLVALAHCGREFRPVPGPRERLLARTLLRNGAALFVGSHPHVAGALEADADGLRVWSLGNFLFDQGSPRADGVLADIVFFPQGTFHVRLLPIGNLYERLRSEKMAVRDREKGSGQGE